MATFNGRGFKIHYVEQGHGPAIVFAHGFVMDHTMFGAQFEDLPDTHRCLAWDMRGHGESDCPPGPWTMQDTVVDLIRFIEGTDSAPCHLVGMSWGGMIALRVALQREDLVRSLVVIDASADAEDPERVELYRGFAKVVEEQGVTPELEQASLPFFYGQKYIASETDAIALHVDRAVNMPRESIVWGLEALWSRDSVLDRLPEIRVPALIIHGEEDLSIPMSQAEKTANGISKARLVRVPEAGHTTPMEAPDVVNRALTEFLETA